MGKPISTAMFLGLLLSVLPATATRAAANGASGAVIRRQNSSVVRSTPARYVSDPNVTMSGTTRIPSAVATAGSRSDAESVTKTMRATAPSRLAIPVAMIRDRNGRRTGSTEA